MNIITVSGKAQSGKDTFARFAQDYLNKNNKKCIIFHYADFLKYICKQYYGWNGIKDETGRSLLQTVGTEIFRKNNPNCWTEMAVAFVSGIGDSYDFCIIPDTRFPNEIQCWDNYKHTDVYIERPNFDNGLTNEQKNHESENALNNWIFSQKIINDGTLDDYDTKIKSWIEQRYDI